MRSRLLVSVFAFTLTGVVASCGDEITAVDQSFEERATWVATMNGANERPTPVATPATGRAYFIDNGTSITYYMEYNGLIQNASNAHIHRGTADVAGGVTIQLLFIPRQSGVVTGTIDMTLADVSPSETGVQSPDDLRALLNSGGSYVNVHSSSPQGQPQTGFPGGEIRGQIVPR